MRGTLKSFLTALTWWILPPSQGKILTLGARTAAIYPSALKENRARLFSFAWRALIFICVARALRSLEHCAIDERNTCRFIDRNDLR